MRQMKDSKNIYIKEIPLDWQVVPIKRVKDTSNPYPIGDGDHGQISPEDYQSQGIPYIRVQNLSWGKDLKLEDIVYISEEVNQKNIKSVLHPGDILVAKTGATIGKTALIPESIPVANTTSSVGKITVSPQIDNRFVLYALQSDVCFRQIWSKADQKSAQPGFNIIDLERFLIPLPKSKDDQTRIADYLDMRCSQIDSLIEKQEAIIEKLKEYKLSVITEAVTKGLDPNVEMKDSGIDYIGLVPVHWQVMKFGYCVDIKSNLVDPNEYKDYPQISPESIEKGSAKLLHYQTVEESGVISWNHLFYKGQIVYSKIRPLLDKVIIAPFDGLCSADMYPIETDNDIDFIVFLMLSRYFHSQVALVTENRVKMPKINQNELSDIVVAVPPVEEQISISSALNKLCNEIDEAIHNRTDLIERLKTYKKSLIYEVVTGKKEV